MTCDNCNMDKQHLHGAILQGKYGQYCLHCMDTIKRPHHAGSAQYARDRDREDHEADLLQPWDQKGNPSKEFITHYPEEAHDIFSKEELEQYG